MTKKIFAQPEMMVVYVKNNDIITDSQDAPLGGSQDNDKSLAPGLRGIFDPYTDWQNAGY